MEEERRILEFYFHEFGHSFSVSIGYDSLYSFLNFRFKDFMNEYKDHLEPKSYNMSKKELNTYINSEYSDLVKLLCKLPFEIFRLKVLENIHARMKHSYSLYIRTKEQIQILKIKLN